MIIIIPARLKSGRVPRKMLEKIGDKSVIEHTYSRTLRAQCATRVVIAVDDDEVEAHCKHFCPAVINTKELEFNNGTERCAHIADELGFANSVKIINVQGDNYDVKPAAIDNMAKILTACSAHNKQNTMFCMCEDLSDREVQDSSVVKVLRNTSEHSLFFTRLPVQGAQKHCGIYGYHVSFLHTYMDMDARDLERAEALEQMRVLENGGFVYCPHLPGAMRAGDSINVMQDLERARDRYARGAL